MQECRTLGGCETGSAKITKAYRLPARFVIHAVGPIYSGSPQDPLRLAGCYRTSLRLALENDVASIAFPAISCGVYGYPIADAVQVALDATVEFLATHDAPARVVFALFSHQFFTLYQRALAVREEGRRK